MSQSASRADRSLADWVDELQAGGRYTFHRQELSNLDDRSPVALDASLRRLKQKSRIQSPRRGFFVIVPVEYRSAGCPPASWFIADLMIFLGQPYYVGILTAAALHGAGHQQPMSFQVVTDQPTRPARAGRVRIEFHQSGVLAETPVVDMTTETGSMPVATPEATAFDLVRYPAAAGYLDHAVTVLSELVERMQPNNLVECAAKQAVPDAQRIGFLLECIGQDALAEELWDSLASQRLRTVLLVPKRARGRKKPDPRWRVLANWKLEIDP
jgi:predicted transcriptional regulator of viral defense system